MNLSFLTSSGTFKEFNILLHCLSLRPPSKKHCIHFAVFCKILIWNFKNQSIYNPFSELHATLKNDAPGLTSFRFLNLLPNTLSSESLRQNDHHFRANYNLYARKRLKSQRLTKTASENLQCPRIPIQGLPSPSTRWL